MKIREWTSEDIQWLKDNYATKSDHACKTHFKTTFQQLWLKVDELGLKKDKPSDFELLRLLYRRGDKKMLHKDQEGKGYCLDCPRYRVGGFCSKTGKEVGALWQKKCYQGEVNPPHSQQQLKNLNTMEEIKSKQCSRCGRTLPVTQFGTHARNKDGYDSLCKECKVSVAKKGGRPKKSDSKAVDASEGHPKQEVSYKGLVEVAPEERASLALRNVVGERTYKIWVAMTSVYEEMVSLYKAEMSE